tara:strand:- start:418 stop:1173 length:756 start_codon:yes stop_codon:yes gene_type:complete
MFEKPNIKFSLRKKSQFKLKIGLITLSSDLTIENDFRLMLSKSKHIAYYVNRIENKNPLTLKNLKRMEKDFSKVVKLLVPDERLDVLAYGCTSGTVAIGYDKILNRVNKIRPRVPLVTPITSAIKAIKKLKIKKLSVLTPYPDDINKKIATYLEKNELQVISFTALKLTTDTALARVEPSSIYKFINSRNVKNADGLFISCTGLRSVEVIKRIETKINKPVITSNQAMLWDCMRSCHDMNKIKNFGKLLRI